jgi:Tfp pilus assembly protein PilO
MRRVIRKPRTWIVTIVLAAGAMGYVWFVFLPGQKSIAQLRSEVQEKRQFITQTDRLAPVSQQVELELAAARNYVYAWRSRAPKPSGLAELYGEITVQAKQSGVQILRFEPQSIVRLESLCRVPLAIRGQGSFQQVFLFLQHLEELPATLWFENLKLEPDGQDRDLLRFEMMLVIFADNHDFSENRDRNEPITEEPDSTR